MRRNTTYNILMYSHDTYGLGHIRRTMSIASHLRQAGVNILILTGSPIAGRFAFPEGIDFVRIPGMIKKTNQEYLPLSIKINANHALNIRKSIITATAKTFQPDLFIVDKEPLGLKQEIHTTLKWLRRCQPRARTILGLRDIMDDAETIQSDWEKKRIYETLDELYTEIWVYGNREFYDPIREYAIPESVSRKIRFTGYIPRKVPTRAAVSHVQKELSLDPNQKLVVVTTGGGGDGYRLIETYLSMLESLPRPLPFQSVLVTGPFMPQEYRKAAFARARQLKVWAFHFYRQMEKLLAAADLVVTMGGYNTLCEILSQGTVTLVVPRERPRKEQLIRAQAFKQQDLTEYIRWGELSPDNLKQKVFELLEHPQAYQTAISRFEMSGLEVMRQRLETFQSEKNHASR